MTAPSTDRSAITQIINAAVKGGWSLDHVDDYEEHVPVANKTEALDAIMAVDMAYLHVRKAGSQPSFDQTGWIWFVMGNEPYEVAADYTSNLEPVIGPLWEKWEDAS